MYERGSFARRLASDGPTAFGTWVKLPTLETVELLGHAGFDFIVVDMEHAPLTLESAYRAIVMAQAMGMGALVRVPDRSDSHLQRLARLGRRRNSGAARHRRGHVPRLGGRDALQSHWRTRARQYLACGTLGARHLCELSRAR